MRIVFIHGWGYSPSFWQPLCRILGDDGIVADDDCVFLDPGYVVGTSRLDLPSDGQPYWVVGHSLGAAYLLKSAFRDEDSLWCGFISCCSFSRFCRADDFPRGAEPNMLTMMQTRIRQDQPSEMMADFYAACGDTDPPSGPFDAEYLGAGLSFLASCDIRTELAELTCPLLVLAARNDAIIPPAMIEASFAGNADIVWSDDGGHVLPKSRPLWCARQIESFINRHP